MGHHPTTKGAASGAVKAIMRVRGGYEAVWEPRSHGGAAGYEAGSLTSGGRISDEGTQRKRAARFLSPPVLRAPTSPARAASVTRQRLAPTRSDEWRSCRLR